MELLGAAGDLHGGLSIALVTLLIFHAPTLRHGVNLGDEGYLLYGSAALARGRLPIRDFRAYDPGRYFWCAPWLKLLGPTFFTQRLAMGSILLAALTLALVTIAPAVRSWPVLVLAAVLVCQWMKPYYKAFEIFFCVLFVALGQLLLQQPSAGILFTFGLAIGLALFFGLNITAYGCGSLAALLAVTAFTSGSLELPLLGWAVLGFLLGGVPMWTLLAGVEGFARAYERRKIRPLLERRSTNLRLPLPWLWNRDATHLQHLGRARSLFFKALFTLVPLWLAFGGWRILAGEPAIHPLFTSAFVVGAVHYHATLSRADVEHVFSSAVAWSLALTVWLATSVPAGPAIAVLGALTALSLWALGPEYVGLLDRLRHRQSVAVFDTGRERLRLDRPTYDFLSRMRDLVEGHSRPGERVFFAPFLPSFYPLFDRRAAVYDTFCVYPASEAAQQSMIEALADAPLVVIHDAHLDNRPELAFSRTHPQVWRHLHQRYTELADTGLPSDLSVWVLPHPRAS